MSYERWPAQSGSTFGVFIAASTNNTKGSYSELSASTANNSSLWWASIYNMASGRTALVDFAIGAAGSEVVQLANVLCQSGNDASGPAATRVEANSDIAAATRIASRAQFDTASGAVVLVFILLSGSSLASRALPLTYGSATAASNATTIDPGGSANTKGSYAQITASTTADASQIVSVIGNNINTAPTFCQWAVDVATGAAASEVVQLPDLGLQCSDLGGDQFLPSSQGPFPLTIASGTRLSMRAACTITDATNRLFQAELIAGPVISSGGGSAGGAWAFA